MNQKLTPKEINKIQKMCFENPSKVCAIAQLILDTCQVMSCSTFARLKNKSKRTILYQAGDMPGVSIEGRRFVSFI